MSVLRWLAQSFAPRARLSRAVRETPVRRQSTRLSVTLLESRLAPAVLTVNTLYDAPISAAGPMLTLRDAVALIDSNGTAVDASGRSLAAVKAKQIDTATPFGTDDIIQFAPSLFSSGPKQIVLKDGELVLDHSATITGPSASQLVIDGNNQSTLFEVDAAGVSISGLTIADGTASSADGGGLVNNGTLTLTDTVVSGNAATQGDGGGIVNNGTLSLVRSTVSGNTALNDGGLVNNGTLTLTESSVSGNTAVQGNGGLANYGGTLALIDSAVSGNTANGAGGIGNYDNGTTLLLNTTVSGNSAGTAGGIFNTATMTLLDSTVSDNVAISGGGGIINNAALSLTDSNVVGNSANMGGGIGNFGGTLTLSNSNVADNVAVYDGGLVNTHGATMILTESSVSGNTAVQGNGGLANYGGALTLVDSNVTGNTASGAGGLGNYLGGTTLLLNSDVSGNTAAFAGGVFNTAHLTLVDSTISDNVASDAGGGIVSSGTLALTESTVSGNTAALWNAGIVIEEGGTLALADSNVPGITDVPVRDDISASTLPLASSTVADNAPTDNLVNTNDTEILAINNASLLNTGAQLLPESVSSGDSIRNENSVVDTESSPAVTSANGSVNTGTPALNVSAVVTGVTLVGNDGSTEDGDTLMPTDSAVAVGSSNSGDTNVQTPVDNNRPADGAITEHLLRVTQEEMAPLAGKKEQEVALPSQAHATQEQVATVVSLESNTEDAGPDPFVLLSGESSLDQEPGFRVELTTGKVAALLLLVPWLPNTGNVIEEQPAESEELLKRNKNRR